MNNCLDKYLPIVEDAYSSFKKGYYSEITNQFYDYRTSDDINQTLRDLPSLEEVKRQWPNFVGWGTGMEDNNITESYMLISAMEEYRLNHNKEYLDDIHNFAKGLLLNAEVSSQTGFLVRNVHPEDCKTHYINSSRDQYTYWIYAMSRYLDSEFSNEDEKKRIRKALVNFAIKAEKDVIPENDYCLTKEDGTPAVASTMLRDTLPAEALRLCMIYIAAYYASGNNKWLDLYRKYRKETLSLSETIDVSVFTGQIIAPMQMMVSMRYIFELEEDESYKKRYLALMKKVSNGIMEHVNNAYHKIDSFNEYNKSIHYLKPFRENECVNVGRLWEYGYDLYAYFVVNSTYHGHEVAPRVIAEGLMIQALCPERDTPKEQLDIFLYTLKTIKLNDAAFYYPSYYIACYWILRNK